MLDTRTDTLIRGAIARKRLIRFWLDGHQRMAEPHDYGIRNAATQLLVFQIGGGSRSGRLPDWRWVDLSRVSGLEVLEQTFPGRRAAPSGQHARWDRLFARVDEPTDEHPDQRRDDEGPAG